MRARDDRWLQQAPNRSDGFEPAFGMGLDDLAAQDEEPDETQCPAHLMTA
jgi:hypothetical protein